MTKALAKKVAIVTGASSGIGRATALLFAAKGASVVLSGRRETALKDLQARLADDDRQAVCFAGDIRSEDYWQRLVELAQSRFGKLDIAFNCAGALGTLGPVETLSTAAWQETMDTNLTSAFFAAKHQLPALRKTGNASLIFVSTFVGHTVGLPGMSAYAASKAGLLGLVKVLAAECAQAGVRVNALLPGGTDTAMAGDFSTDPGSLEFAKSLHATQRLARPEEIAQSALYLASDASSFTTGTALLADGGASIYRA